MMILVYIIGRLKSWRYTGKVSIPEIQLNIFFCLKRPIVKLSRVADLNESVDKYR